MKRGCVLGLIALIALAALLAMPPVREEIHWRRIASSPHPEAFQGLLARWPNGRHAEQARVRLEQTTWTAALAAGEPALHDYLARFPAGTHARQARARLEELLWQQVSKQRTAAAFDRYLRAFPQGRFVAAATAQRQAVLADEGVFAAAERQGNRDAYQTFLANYPGHAREAAARAVLADMDGRDLFDLLAEKKVEARATGAGIESVSLELRRRVPYPLRVLIPVGTYFASHDGDAQSMVTVAGDEATLASEDWQSVSVTVACADLHLDVPGEDTAFTVRRAPAQRELQKLMPVLAKASAEEAVRQAAVWILSDDASYEDLGTLVESSSLTGFGGVRVINAAEAVQALQLLAEAGISLRDKAIWSDRGEMIEELDEASEKELAAWLRHPKP